MYIYCRLKKIQKKKAQRRADKEKELAAYKAASAAQGAEHDTGANNLIEDDRDDDLLFEN